MHSESHRVCVTQVKDTRVLVAADQPRMTEKLQEANLLLEDIQRGLNEYLEKKRLFFPRYAMQDCSFIRTYPPRPYVDGITFFMLDLN